MKKLLLSLALLTSMNSFAGYYPSSCTEVYETGIAQKQEYINNWKVFKTMKEIGPGLAKEMAEDGHGFSAAIWTIGIPVYTPLLTGLSFFIHRAPAKKDLKTYKLLVQVLKDKASTKTIKKLKRRLRAKRMSNATFLEKLNNMNFSLKLCRLERTQVSLSERGMEVIQARGYSSAMEAMFAGMNEDKQWWDEFSKDNRNFELSYFGALKTREIRKLFKK